MTLCPYCKTKVLKVPDLITGNGSDIAVERPFYHCCNCNKDIHENEVVDEVDNT